MVVFVGPNGSGKSLMLGEIHQYCRAGNKNTNQSVLDTIVFTGLPRGTAESAVARLRVEPNAGEVQQEGHVIIGSKEGRMQVLESELLQLIREPQLNQQTFCSWFLRHQILKLDATNRINLVNQQPAGDLQARGHSCLQVLFQDDKKRERVRQIIFDAFGKHFVIDPTNLGQLRARLSRRKPASSKEERGIDDEAVQFHAAADLIDKASDGVRSFVGIIAELVAGDPHIVLIDEPEAFLPPVLASKLGSSISAIATQSDKRVFVATHSANFLMGCVQSGVPTTIVRLDYRDNVGTARVLANEELVPLMRNPLLRSTGILSGLFYDSVVVTESDTDRAFYSEVNERLLRFKPDWGIPNCLFVNAQNKQTVHTLVKPLRRLGIPAAAIVDIDALKEGGKVWMNLLECAAIPPMHRSSLATLRAAVLKQIVSTGKDMKRQGGVELLAAPDKEAAETLLQQLSDYGIFILPGGELECWLKELGATGHGPEWLIAMFELMGESPDDPGYTRPSIDGVWAFLSTVRRWLMDPRRKGIPV